LVADRLAETMEPGVVWDAPEKREEVMTVRTLFSNADERRTYAEGETVFEEADYGEHMFGVVAGSVELRKNDRVMVTRGPGEVFGELALIDRSPRTLTAVAVEPTELAVIDRHRFLFFIHETPTFALDVMQSMGELLRGYAKLA
jgi:CRP-like cAMP-binding protein